MKVIGSIVELMKGGPPHQGGSQNAGLSRKTASFDKMLRGLLQQLGEPSGPVDTPAGSVGIRALLPEQRPTHPLPEETPPVDVAERVKSLILQLQQEEGKLPEAQPSDIRAVLTGSGEASTLSFGEIVTGESSSQGSTPFTNPTSAKSGATASKDSSTATTRPDTRAPGRKSTSSPTIPASPAATDHQGEDLPIPEVTPEAPKTGEGSSENDKENTPADDPAVAADRRIGEAAPAPPKSTAGSSAGRPISRPNQPAGSKNRPSTAETPAQTNSSSPSTPPAVSKSSGPQQISRTPSPLNPSDPESQLSQQSTGEQPTGNPSTTTSSTAASQTVPPNTRETAKTQVHSGDRDRPSSPPKHSSSGKNTASSAGRTEPQPVPQSKSRNTHSTTESQPAARSGKQAARPDESRRPQPNSNSSVERPEQTSEPSNRPDSSRSTGRSTSSDTTANRRARQSPRPPQERNRPAASPRGEGTGGTDPEGTDSSSKPRTGTEMKAAAKETAPHSRPDSGRGRSYAGSAEKNGGDSTNTTQNGTKNENRSAAPRDGNPDPGSNRRQNSERKNAAGQTSSNETAPPPSSTSGEREFSVGEKATLDREVAEKPAPSQDTTARTGKGAAQNGSTRQSSRSGQPFLSAAWRRAIHNGSPRSYRMENGWHVLTMELDEDKSQMTVKTRPGDDKVSVSVGMSDPKLRSLVAANTERLQAALRMEYEADIDFSLSGDDGQPTGNADANQSSDRGSAGPHLSSAGEQGMDEDTSDRDRRGLYSSFEWIG